MGIDDSGLLLISPAKKQPAAIASRSWDGCTKQGEGGEPDSHSESKYMVLKVFREQVLCSASKPLLSFQLDSSAGAVHTQTQGFCQDRHTILQVRIEKTEKRKDILYVFLVYNIKYRYGSVSSANTLNELNFETDMSFALKKNKL